MVSGIQKRNSTVPCLKSFGTKRTNSRVPGLKVESLFFRHIFKFCLPIIDENRYAMAFGGEYGYKDGAESMILSVGAESMIPLVHISSSVSTGLAVCRRRAADVAATVVLHADGVMVSHLFPALDIGMTASSVIAAIVLGAFVLRVDTKMVPTMMTLEKTNEMHHSTPFIPPSDPHPREGKGKGNEGKSGGHGRGSWW